MIENISKRTSQEQSMTFPRNEKSFKLYLNDYIIIFLGEITVKFNRSQNKMES